MGRLCGGAHEISGIPAPLWLCGWVVGGFLGFWVGVGWVSSGVDGDMGGGWGVGLGAVGFGVGGEGWGWWGGW